MKPAFIFFSFFLIILSIGLPKHLAEVSENLRNLCSSYVPKTQFQELNSALTCGTQLKNARTKGLFKSTGLIHLIIVSGSHLVFLQNLIALILSVFNNTFSSFRVVSIALLFFTLMTGLQAPCARAFIQFLFNWLNKRHRLFWRPWQITLFSGLLCLALFPAWIKSLSLLLSWLCAFALSVSPRASFKQHIVIYIILLPILASFSLPHPFVILINLIVSPIFGVVLFPLSLFSVFFPILTHISDPLWLWLLKGLEHISLFTSSLGTFSLSLTSQWLFLLICHFCAHFAFIKRAQRV